MPDTNNNRPLANGGVWAAIRKLPAYCKITIGAEDSPATNERLITFQAFTPDGKPYSGYVQAKLSAHSAAWGALDTDECLDMAGTGPVGTIVNFTDGTSSAAFSIGDVVSNSAGKISVVVNDTGNDTFYIRCDYGAGMVYESDAVVFGSG